MSSRWIHLLWLLCLPVLGCLPGSSGPVGGEVVSGAVLSGTIQAARLQTGAPAPTLDEGFMVVAQSNETGEIYRAMTDADGNFELNLPASESGNTFVVTIVDPDGRAVGPVLYGTASGSGLTGLSVAADTSLGTINLPEDPNTAPVQPGTDVDLSAQVDDTVSTRVDEDGVPVGMGSFGKGDDAKDTDGAGGQTVDADQDGLIDFLDADDDGDGIVDDFDGEGDTGGEPNEVGTGFFMNLKIDSAKAPTYYAGDANAISAALATDTIITMEVMAEPSATKTVSSVRLLETPGPAYLPTASKVVETLDGLDYETWADSNYAFDEQDDRFDVFVRPNTEMAAGDTFTCEVMFGDGSVVRFTRMINYVFKNIPKLVEYGSTGAMTAFDVNDTTVNGSDQKPIPFDGTQDLVLVFNPPKDELGAYVENMDYSFTIFYTDSNRQQLNDQIDYSATWPTMPSGFDNGTYWVDKSQLTLSASDTYTFTLPKEVFPDTVVTSSGTADVAQYKIDITAEASSGNAAIMLHFEKQ